MSHKFCDMQKQNFCSTLNKTSSEISITIRQSVQSHYVESPIFVQKFNFDKTPTFSRIFHQIFFLIIFLAKSKLSTAKKSKITTFSRVFHLQKIDNFLEKSKLNFWTKNEDFEQCVRQLFQFILFFCSFIMVNSSNLLFCAFLLSHALEMILLE